ncbi:MAG: non-heme iron oxygenase ferredoxin subunit [Actinobacteria bacterium]|nr:non-heme iron oxygenase ferredoxin subunit [Actinomycetota bacterium]MCB9412393.1 non-heme iron oxygenase ferredoxin subunit [Actinomycetota bacterium]
MSEATFHDVARFGDLADGEATRVIVDGQAIALVLTGGDIYAVSDSCSHADVSLSEGDVEGCFIECWLHGSQFDLRTGNPTCLPANEPIATYQAKISGSGPDARVLVSVD